ncbi:MAG: nucleotidyltransferase domain-containing protein, partial [Clostridiaceae bacterium]
MIQKNLDEINKLFKDNLKSLLQEYDIKLIYIFGSYAKGNNNANSDLDIAVLLNNDYDPMDKLSLIGDLTSIFKRNDIDLVILNSANSVLKHQVIKYGKLIFMENEDIKVN